MAKSFLALLLILQFVFLAACSGQNAGLSGEDVLFHDEFVSGQMGNWQMEGDALGRTSIVNEQLLLDLNTSNIMQFATLASPSFQDFVLDVAARPLQGDPANSYGVLFRLQNPNQFYRFELAGNGTYMLERRNADGTWTRLVKDWTAHPAIQQGNNNTNRIRIEAVGPLISAYVNDTLVQQASDATYAGGQIALDAGTFGDPTMQVAFDNVVVRQVGGE